MKSNSEGFHAAPDPKFKAPVNDRRVGHLIFVGGLTSQFFVSECNYLQ
jgi:hypothetical protein